MVSCIKPAANFPLNEKIDKTNWNLPECIHNIDYYEVATVRKVIDGDSIEIELNGKILQVRYIGINAPDYNLGVDAAARAAERANRELVEGKKIQMFRDTSDTDKFDRLLRYVFVEGIFVNQWLIKQGFAQVKSYPPDTACHSLFLSTQ